MTGYVYLLRCQSRYKIGIAGDVAKRLSGIQTSNPFPVELVASTKVESPRDLETELHAAYSHRRAMREWFDLTPDEVGAVLAVFQDRHRPNIEAEAKKQTPKERKTAQRELRATAAPKANPNLAPMPECYWIANHQQKRTRYMLSKQDGLDLFCSYLAFWHVPCNIGNFGHTVKVKGFKDQNWFEDAVAHLEDAEICMRAVFNDEDLSVVIYGANAVKNAKGQTYFTPVNKQP